jgi:MFS family permease
MTILKAGFVASLPAIAGFLGGIIGGWVSDRLAKSGYSLSVSRKVPIVFGMLMSTSMIACNYIQTDTLVVAVMSLAFFAMQRHLLLSKQHLLQDHLTPAVRQAVLRRNAIGLLPYAVATVGGIVSPFLTLAICAGVAVFYALPRTTSDVQPQRDA